MAQPNTNNYSISTTPCLIGDLQTTITGTGLSVPNSNPIPTAVSGVPVAAAHEIQSTTGLALVPRLSDANITAITAANPNGIVNGMFYYNTTDNVFYFVQNGVPTPIPTGAGSGNVVGPNTPVIGTLAYFPSNLSPNIQDTNAGTFGINILANELIVSGSPGTANQLATFTGTTLTGGGGGVIQGVPVTISGAGAVAGITTIAVGTGTAGAPSYSFTGHLTTGVYYDTVTNQLALSGAGYPQLELGAVVNAVNYITISGAAAGSEPIISAANSADTDVSITLTPKGAGQVLNANGLVGTPAYSFGADTNIGMYRIGADQLGFATNGILNLQVNNGSVLFPNGAVGTPAVSFISDTNTGMYRIGAEQVGFAANGVLNLQVNNGAVYVPNGTATVPGLAFFAEADTGLWHQGANTIGFAAGGGNQFSVIGSAAATNWLQATGAVDGSDPRISAFGTTDADVSIVLIPKGNAPVVVGSSSTAVPGTLQLLEASANGALSVEISAPANVTAAYSLTLPATSAGTSNGQALVIASGGGTADLTLGFVANTLSSAAVTVSSAQLLALHATPVDLIPAPGTGFFIIPLFYYAYYTYNTTPYTVPSGASMEILIGTNVMDNPHLAAAGFIDQTSSQVAGQPLFLFGTAFAESSLDNQPLQVKNDNATEFTLGDGTVTFVVLYRIVNSASPS